MSVKVITAALQCLGFTERDHSDFMDKGRRATGVVYLYRAPATERGCAQHQYVSLCGYQGEFCEAVVEIYSAPKDTRAKRRAANLCPQSICRSLAEVLDAVSVTYPPSTP